MAGVATFESEISCDRYGAMAIPLLWRGAHRAGWFFKQHSLLVGDSLKNIIMPQQSRLGTDAG